MIMVWVRVRIRARVADCCIQTAGESNKMRINHVIKTDQWRGATQIRPASHFVVSRTNSWVGESLTGTKAAMKQPAIQHRQLQTKRHIKDYRIS